MITPAYSLTATERVLPGVALNFMTGVLDPRVTVTRSLNTATRINSSGYIEIVNANLPRFDYDPSTLLCLGLLIEEQRSNLFLYSEEFDRGVWNSGGTVTANTAISPSGLQNADTCAVVLGGSVTQNVSGITAGNTYTISIWVRSSSTGGATNVRITTNNTLAWNTGITQSFPLTSSWQRISLTGVAISSGTTVRVLIGSVNINGDSDPACVGNIDIWGAQLEAGAFATSYIPTTTTSLTRNADVVQMTGTNFSDWYTTGGTNETWTARVLARNLRNGDRIVAFDTGFAGASAYRGPILDTFDQLGAYDGTADRIFGGISGTGIRKLATAYSGSTMSGSINGSIAGSAFDGNMNPSTTLGIGSYAGAASGYINSWMQYLSYYPQRLTDRELQALTT